MPEEFNEFEWWKAEIKAVADEYYPKLEKLKDKEWEKLIEHVIREMESELPNWVEDWLYEQKKIKLEEI
jgi:RecG-like helicase